MKNRLNAAPCGRILLILSLTLCNFAIAQAASAAGPNVATALGLIPKQRDDVEYDQPTASDAARCTIAPEKIDGKTGWTVRDSNSRTLRRFVDTNNDNVVDLWCYYRGGIEVYRDIDSNFNGKPDQYRWLNTAGSRWGMDRDENGTIDAWKVISAQEASAECVAAMAKRDEQRFRVLLLTADELRDLGVGEAMNKTLNNKIDSAPGKFRQAMNRKSAITPQSEWVHFSAAQPGLVPAGNEGSTKDLMVYENVAAMVETGGKQSLLNVGTMVAVGDTWKLVDAPGTEADGVAGEVAGAGLFFQVALRNTPAGGATNANDSVSEEVQKLLATLEGIEKSTATATEAQKPKLNEERSDALEKLMDIAKDSTQRDAWGHQLADTISAAIQSGTYPEGLKRIEALAEKVAADKKNPELAAYVKYRALMASYTLAMQEKGAEFGTVQANWLKSLEKFVTDYPDSPDTSDAMLQLAIAQEFAGEDAKARDWYDKILQKFSQSPAAKKATGARRRLDSVGQVLTFKGPDLAGRTVDLTRYRGRVVLIQYWATWCEPCKADMTTLKGLVGVYGQQGFSVIGINLDQDRQTAADFLKKESLPWANIYEPGGLESRLSTELGVLTLPTMLLLDQQGKVVNRNIHATQVESELKNRLKPAAPAK
ncbi:MAG: redoxin family protein [Planctomycetes bacterium]|nr:redoxin family protein [Planctomycetota bacterium]